MASTNDICNKAAGPPNWLRDSQCRNFAQSYDITRSSASMGCSGPKWNQLGDGSLQHPVDAGTGSRSSNSGEPVTITDQQLSARDAWQNAQLKVDIVTHPRYEQLLAAHVDCLQVATPVDHLPSIEAQLANAQQVAARYSVSGRHTPPAGDEKEELDHFMGSYIVLLQSFKDQLHEHMRVHAMDAILDCWQLEQAFTKLTGLPLGEGSGATMSEDDNECIEENELHYVDNEIYDGFGPLIPSETERSLMERVRQELKLEFKQEYRSRISDVREEILRKRRAGKLPGETTSLLKRWWSSHSKWPYPTEEEKARLVQETGLELKQINNWFINQRKRNWHNNNNNNNSSHNNNIQSISPSILTQK